eukprot:PhF_6_TR44149/c0_g2_i1/m.67528
MSFLFLLFCLFVCVLRTIHSFNCDDVEVPKCSNTYPTTPPSPCSTDPRCRLRGVTKNTSSYRSSLCNNVGDFALNRKCVAWIDDGKATTTLREIFTVPVGGDPTTVKINSSTYPQNNKYDGLEAIEYTLMCDNANGGGGTMVIESLSMSSNPSTPYSYVYSYFMRESTIWVNSYKPPTSWPWFYGLGYRSSTATVR